MTRLLQALPRGTQLFVLAFAIVVVAQLLGQSGTKLVALCWPSAGVAAFPAFVVELGTAAMCVLAIFAMGHLYPRPSRSVTVAKAAVTVVGVVATNTLLNTVQACTEGIVGNSLVWWAVLFATCGIAWGVVAVRLLPRVQRWFLLPIDRHHGVKEVRYGDGHVVIVMLVSCIPEDSLTFHEPGAGATVTIRNAKTGDTVVQRLATQSVEVDTKALDNDNGARWPWQQLLRGVAAAIRRTGPGDRTTIVLVGSAGGGGSFPQLPTCMAFLQRYPEMSDRRRVEIMTSPMFLASMEDGGAGGFVGAGWALVERGIGSFMEGIARVGMSLTPPGRRSHVRVEAAEPRPAHSKNRRWGESGIDFENFNDVRDHLFLVVQKASCIVGDDCVFVDVTGGQKTTSIAAAVATTGETGRCQYVQTNWPNRVLLYDLHPPEQFSW